MVSPAAPRSLPRLGDGPGWCASYFVRGPRHQAEGVKDAAPGLGGRSADSGPPEAARCLFLRARGVGVGAPPSASVDTASKMAWPDPRPHLLTHSPDGSGSRRTGTLPSFSPRRPIGP